MGNKKKAHLIITNLGFIDLFRFGQSPFVHSQYLRGDAEPAVSLAKRHLVSLIRVLLCRQTLKHNRA